MRFAERSGLRSLADQWLSVPTDKGANAGKKVSLLVGGMVAGLTRSMTLFIEVHAYQKRGTGFGDSGVRGINAFDRETWVSRLVGEKINFAVSVDGSAVGTGRDSCSISGAVADGS